MPNQHIRWHNASTPQKRMQFSSHRRRGTPSGRGIAPPKPSPVIQAYLGLLGNRPLNVQPFRTGIAHGRDNNDGRSAVPGRHDVELVAADINKAPRRRGPAAVPGLTDCLVCSTGEPKGGSGGGKPPITRLIVISFYSGK